MNHMLLALPMLESTQLGVVEPERPVIVGHNGSTHGP